MAVMAMHVDQGKKYRIHVNGGEWFISTAQGTGEVHYPGRMICSENPAGKRVGTLRPNQIEFEMEGDGLPNEFDVSDMKEASDLDS